MTTKNVLIKRKDGQGNITTYYPITVNENVLGLDEKIREILDGIEIIPQDGEPGPAGKAATIEILETETLPEGSVPYVVNEGTESEAKLKFGIPQSMPGAPGEAGKAATIEISETETLHPSAPPYVVNEGTEIEAKLKFGIPSGFTPYEPFTMVPFTISSGQWYPSIEFINYNFYTDIAVEGVRPNDITMLIFDPEHAVSIDRAVIMASSYEMTDVVRIYAMRRPEVNLSGYCSLIGKKV